VKPIDPKAPRRKPSTQGDTAAIVPEATPERPLGVVVRVLSDGRIFRLNRGTCVIGSGNDVQLRVQDTAVSRKHLQLTLVPAGVELVDLESRNGTLYLGQRVTRMVLGLGGRITIGRTELQVDGDMEDLETGAVYASSSYAGILGPSVAMRRLFGQLARLEGSLVTVLVQGESGAGKEVISQAIHRQSAVRAGPLVSVNCGAIAKELVASELFGHKRGAFTGAHDQRQGAFESANGGTLFLDEVGELPLEVQPALLRALETGEITQLGSNQARTVRVRIVAATNRDLYREVEEGRFRLDLYYRLAVVTLAVPSLRDRPEDVEPLIRLLAKQMAASELPESVVAKLKARSYPGNVRELRNALQSYFALGALPKEPKRSAPAVEDNYQQHVDFSVPYIECKERVVDAFTRVYLEALLEHVDRNQTAAARIAGLDRSYLGKLLQKHGLSR
jgi:two-component system, NtrC family, response regulator GlrR